MTDEKFRENLSKYNDLLSNREEEQGLDHSSLVMSQDEIERQLAHYEQVFGMSSEEFLKRKRDGTVPDTFETMDWMILLRHR